ncbi:helix-turn-helix domain-containing protein [Fimbriimonas ginsengisoli]|nr:helix-turn-helix transcriptional regulator [Fimbriimonas ginsengisoli]
MATETEEKMIDRGNSDVFHDLGLPDADELLAKAKLARAISEAVRARKISQSQLARLTGIDQPKISLLMRGRISGFSSDRLMNILTKLDQDVVIFIRPKPDNRAAIVSVDMAHGL